MADEEQLSYEEVLEYLGDRRGEEAIVSSFPTFRGLELGEEDLVHKKTPTPTMLGLRMTTHVGGIVAVPLAYADFVGDQAAVLVQLGVEGPDGTLEFHDDEGLVLSREWFADAGLSGLASNLTVVVRADPTSKALFPPVGEEGDPDEAHDVREGELVGWGFAFDFDGSPPLKGRWADPGRED